MNSQNQYAFRVIKNYRRHPIRIKRHRKVKKYTPQRVIETRQSQIKKQRFKQTQYIIKQIQRVEFRSIPSNEDPLWIFQTDIKIQRHQRNQDQLKESQEYEIELNHDNYFAQTSSVHLNNDPLDQS